MSSRTLILKPNDKIEKYLKRDEQIVRKSLDARKKDKIRYNYLLGRRNENTLHPEVISSETRPVVVGFGPAGMFAGLYLARAGLKPIIFERGSAAPKRKENMDVFRKGGEFSEINNAQFGEGGAGTFSDGKLNTTTHDKRIGQVLQIFYEHGAPESVLYESKPHLGTDNLINIVQSIRNEIIALGGEVFFDTKVEKLGIEDGSITSVFAGGHEYPCSDVILSIGHSARDTFEVLMHQNIPMEKKAFSIGARIEHLRADIDCAQYGKEKNLPAADYKLSHNGVYTFCMCPGGYVFAANSEKNSVCTNGMSYSGRAGINSNSAVLVTVKTDDIPGDSPLAGVYYQREIEKKAFEYGGGNYMAPVQRLEDFMKGVPSTGHGRVVPTYEPGVKYGDLAEVLPEKILNSIREALPEFDKKLKGFMDPDAILTAPETRSSSPVRIIRDGTYQSVIRGLYPCGEGAGYAGGITSSAVDGLRCAEALIDNRYKKSTE